MMNAELVATAKSRIIVPTAYRNNYLAALKALSQEYHFSFLPLIYLHSKVWDASPHSSC